jgi:hypothetical protein
VSPGTDVGRYTSMGELVFSGRNVCVWVRDCVGRRDVDGRIGTEDR